MDIKNVVNVICLIAGICVLVFAALIAAGIVSSVPVNKSVVLFILGGVIVLWSGISMHRHR